MSVRTGARVPVFACSFFEKRREKHMNKNRKIRHILPKAGMTALMAATAFAGV